MTNLLGQLWNKTSNIQKQIQITSAKLSSILPCCNDTIGPCERDIEELLLCFRIASTFWFAMMNFDASLHVRSTDSYCEYARCLTMDLKSKYSSNWQIYRLDRTDCKYIILYSAHYTTLWKISLVVWQKFVNFRPPSRSL